MTIDTFTVVILSIVFRTCLGKVKHSSEGLWDPSLILAHQEVASCPAVGLDRDPFVV